MIGAATNVTAGVIEIYDNAVLNCGEVLAAIKQQDSWNEALVGEGMGIRDTTIRDNRITWINPFNFRTPPVLYEFVKQIWYYIDDYGQRYNQPFSRLESVNVNKYEPGQQYHVHADSSHGANRVISALVYLNDDFTGGETEFVYFGERVTPQTGRLVIFPSNYAYAHAALPPTDGVKYSAAFWTVG